jgi:DNA repair protein RecN (Recombination protein N)
MLSELLIENFAIIDELLLRFESGFTVLTGETGAGKSIIVDALQAALGARVTSEVVRSGARFAAIEAIFDLTDAGVGPTLGLLDQHGIATGDTIILRREISASGRGTARINGRAVPNAVLIAVGDGLVDIHGQSDHLSILRRDRQLEILDRFGDLLSRRSAVTEAIRHFTRLQQSLVELAGSQRSAEQRLDLLRFQASEIAAARVQANEETELETVRNRLANAEKLAALAASAYEALVAGNGTALDQMQTAATSLRELIHIDPNLASLVERLQTMLYEAEDIGQELRRYRDQMEFEPARLDEAEERLALLQRLKRKYGATLPEVIAFGRQVQRELEDVETLDERLSALGHEVAAARQQAGILAHELSQARGVAAARLTAEMRVALHGLGLPATDFSVDLCKVEDENGLPSPTDEASYAFAAHGVDAINYLVSFNAGEPPRSLEKVASGGETSRFLLALRGVLSRADGTPTLVFDEVDVGVGGKAGTAVGERLRELALRHQVLSVSHLPQVAALADHHLAVLKASTHGRSTVDVRALQASERVDEIAEMMSGTSTEAARRNAEELLAAAERRS